MSRHLTLFLVTGALLGSSAEAQDPLPAVPSETVAPDTKATRLLGNARTGRRRWVTGATVLVQPESGRPDLYLTSTDARGTFRFETVPEGLYRIDIRKHGLAPVVKRNVELRFPFRPVVEVMMEPAGDVPVAAEPASETPASPTGGIRMTGRVRETDGAPIDEVRIRLVRTDASVDPREAMTGPDGDFSFDDLVAGPFRLEIFGAGYLPVRVETALEGDATLTAVLVSQPASYEPQPLDLMPPEEPIPPPPPAPQQGADVADGSTD